MNRSLCLMLLFLLALPGCPSESNPDAPVETDTPVPELDVPDLDAGDLDAPLGEDAPDAPPEGCTMAGAMRTTDCGNCGLQSQRCEGGLWTDVGPCIGEGECAFGALETRRTPACAEEARVCDEACSWSDWDEVTPPGDCTTGESRVLADGCSPGVGRVQVCSELCLWESTPECVDACGDVPRTSPHVAQEICIPAGPFMRGSEALLDTRPMAEVTLSAYYIDRFPVVNSRYAECVAAGGCTVPTDDDGLASYRDAARGLFPVTGVTWAQAVEFCAWDGGRVLPTEAEWEKAARGPSPRTVRYPWGDSRDCAIWYNRDCGTAAITDRRLVDDYDDLPAAASTYGVEMLLGVNHWTGDWYSESYYGRADSRVDPRGPTTGTFRVTRGPIRQDYWVNHDLYRRNAFVPGTGGWGTGFRCARRVP